MRVVLPFRPAEKTWTTAEWTPGRLFILGKSPGRTAAFSQKNAPWNCIFAETTMDDKRAREAQRLLWKVKEMDYRLRRTWLRMAEIHAAMADDLLSEDRPEAYADLLTAATAFAMAGSFMRAGEVLDRGEAWALAAAPAKAKTPLLQEIKRLRGWVRRQELAGKP